MKTAIIVHSLTGNTLSVANRLKDSLEKRGIDVYLEKVEPSGGENKNEMDLKKITFPSRLNLEEFDNIVMAGPVRGFSMSPVLKAYFEESSLKNRKVYMFVTHFFPFAFMGGNSAISQMKNFVEQRGGIVLDSSIIDWKNPSRERKIQTLVELFSKEIQ